MKGLFFRMNKFLTCIMLLPIWLSLQTFSSTSDKPVVHAVLFYSPTCGHCHKVITETLIPLIEQYGEQLVIVGVDISQPDGQTVFHTVLQYFNQEIGYVPFLVIGDTYLVGSADIPEKFPGLVEQYLALGGLDWPAIPGLAEALAIPQPTEVPVTKTPQPELTRSETVVPTPPAPAATVSSSPTPVEATPTSASGIIIMGEQTSRSGTKFFRDPLGNGLAVLVLASMLLSLGGAIIFIKRAPVPGSGEATQSRWQAWLVPILCLVGMAVAGYLAFVETAGVKAVCGPMGDCNTVQQSAYAYLFGILPIGVLGIVGYVLILLAWGAGRSTNQRLAFYGHMSLLALTAFSLLFSIYLTILEPFVIGATCAWCLTSAIIMTALFWLSLTPARRSFRYIYQRNTHLSCSG
jgi:uncharacterized membrane protein/thiol-disulfide isomerase/thioredoxin